MFFNSMSRRSLLKVGAYTLAGTSGLQRVARIFGGKDQETAAAVSTFRAPQSAIAAIAAEGGSTMIQDQIIRNYYSGWEKKEWSTIDSLLADSFTFTSPNDDDHIDKHAFKARCWPEADHIKQFQLESVISGLNVAFVKYLCETRRNTSFRNIEYFRFADGKITAIECYFGGHIGHPSQQASISR
jgi:hypothetical protein